MIVVYNNVVCITCSYYIRVKSYMYISVASEGKKFINDIIIDLFIELAA